jgi:hypothetical protein
MSRRNGDAALLPFADRLGREPDHVIARDAGVSRAFVVSYRKRRGIQAYEGYKFGYDGTGHVPSSGAPVNAAPRGAGGAARSPVQRTTREGSLGASNEQRFVYRMVVDECGVARDYAIIAQSLVSAVQTAEKACSRIHPTGTLRSVERVAPLLEP